MKKIFLSIVVLGLVVGAFFGADYLLGKKGVEVPVDENGTVSLHLNQARSVLGVTIKPLEVLEDSRCPKDVTCVWAGTVRLRASLESGLGTADQIFEIGQPVTTESEEITLTAVEPVAVSTKSIRSSDYVFTFDVRKRSERDTSAWDSYVSETFGFSFLYPEYYHLETKEVGDGHTGHFVVVLTEDTEANRAVREGKAVESEGPPAITFELFQSPKTLDPVAWITEEKESNFSLGDGRYTPFQVSGHEGVRYQWSGLYEGRSFVVANKDYILFVSGTYLASEDAIYTDFNDILRTISF